jgi:hypothetical protein
MTDDSALWGEIQRLRTDLEQSRRECSNLRIRRGELAQSLAEAHIELSELAASANLQCAHFIELLDMTEEILQERDSLALVLQLITTST